MGKITKTLTAVLMMAVLAACGGDPEADARDQLKEFGFSDDLTNCVMDEIKKNAGDFDKFADLDATEQQEMAAQAGASCAQSTDPEDLTDLLENNDVDLSDENVRKGFVEGMTSTGVPEDTANCIADKAIADDLAVSELTDPATIQELAAACQ